MAAACQLAKARLAVATQQLSGPSSLASRAGTGIRAGYIAGVKTPAKGILGNSSWLTFRTLAGQPAQAAVDYVRSLGVAASKGDIANHAQYREVINGTNLAGLEAFKRGWATGVDEVKGGLAAAKAAYQASPGTSFGERIAAATAEMKLHIMDANKAASLLDYTPTQYKNPLAQAMADASFLLVEAVDRPFYWAAEQMSLTMQARLAAVKAGAKGDKIQVLANQILQNPTDDMVAQASFDAHYATFKDRGVMAKAAEQVKRGLERASEAQPKDGTKAAASVAAMTRAAGTAGKIMADVALPFTGVPTSVAAKGIGLTPLGLLALRRDMGGAMQSRIVADALLGFGGVALGLEWAKDGIITGKLTPQERADNPDLQEYSINVGGQSLSLQSLGPIGVPLFAGAALAKTQAKDPGQGIADQALTVGRSAIEQTVNSTYAQGIKQIVDAAGDERKSVSSLAGNLVPIPSLVTQVARATDPQPREARTILEKIINKTPLSPMLEPATTSTGIARPRTAAERIGAIASPVSFKEDKSPPALLELRRLGVGIGKPDRTMQVRNQKVDISAEQMQGITERQGEYIIPAVEKLLTNPSYLGKTDEQKAAILERVVTAQKARAKLPAKREAIGMLGGRR